MKTESIKPRIIADLERVLWPSPADEILDNILEPFTPEVVRQLPADAKEETRVRLINQYFEQMASVAGGR